MKRYDKKNQNQSHSSRDKKNKPVGKSGSFSREGKVEEKKFKKVYKGRGKNEKPVYEFIPDDSNEKKSAPKKSIYTKKEQHKPQEAIKKPDYNFKKFEKKASESQITEEIRLNKYISNSGICSRRDADKLIQKGEISVNGEIIRELGYKVKRTDKVKFKNRLLNPEKPVYLLLNKPKDYITTTNDPFERKTVMNLVKDACEERLFPVGRLDRNTTGLLLFTNDGELAEMLAHPGNKIKKIYQVNLDKALTKADLESILEGVELEDGHAQVDDLQILSKDKTILGLEIHSGKNRIVRRIFAHFGYEVEALDRVMYAGLTKKDIPRGQFRFLTEKEVINLKFFNKGKK